MSEYSNQMNNQWGSQQNTMMNDQWQFGGAPINSGVDYLNQQNYNMDSIGQQYDASSGVPQQTSMWEGFQNTLGGIFNKEAMFGSPQSDGKGGTIQGQGWTGQGLSALQGIGNYILSQENAQRDNKRLNFQIDDQLLKNRNYATQSNEQLGLRGEAKGASEGFRGDALTQYTDNYVKENGVSSKLA
jgi:hypothetical protein